VNRKLNAMNKLLMEENDRLQKQVSRLVYENGYMRTQLHNPSAATTDTSCESVVTSGQHHQQQNPAVLHPQRDANNPAGYPQNLVYFLLLLGRAFLYERLLR
jgi:homeobox-leucine zipper protein